MLERIVSGGQTGVDRAALDAAMARAVPCSGWCPRGRLAEDGTLDPKYPLQETPTRSYAQRTEWNVRDADATLILASSKLTGGTALTRDMARRYQKPCLVVDPDRDDANVLRVMDWLRQSDIQVLNVAGPRESLQPGVYERAFAFLSQLLAAAIPSESQTH